MEQVVSQYILEWLPPQRPIHLVQKFTLNDSEYLPWMIVDELLHRAVQIHTKQIELIFGLDHEMKGSKELFFGESDAFNEGLSYQVR